MGLRWGINEKNSTLILSMSICSYIHKKDLSTSIEVSFVESLVIFSAGQELFALIEVKLLY